MSWDKKSDDKRLYKMICVKFSFTYINLFETTQSTSKYDPECQKEKYGGTLIDELDTTKRVNQICEKLGILPQNPEINATPNHKYQVILKQNFVSW
jgi:hypothetical protein